jgi:hypothetical protein
MKKYVRNVNPCAFILVLCCLLLLGGCINAATQKPSAASPQVVKIDVNVLSGIWFCKLDTGRKVEISFKENQYNIKIDGVDNHRGAFSLQKANNNHYITFEVQEKFDETIDWKRQHVLYSLEDENLILRGGYKGTYTKRSK